MECLRNHEYGRDKPAQPLVIVNAGNVFSYNTKCRLSIEFREYPVYIEVNVQAE